MVKNSTGINLFIKIIESLTLGTFFGFVPVYFCLIVTILITSTFWGTKSLGLWVLWSLVPAVLMDIIFLRKWIKNAYQINGKILALIYMFYSIIALGMFMGIPIGALVLGIGAGLFSARKIQNAADTQIQKQALRKTARFCTAVMGLMCCLIALWAIAGQMIGYKFETPFLSLTLTVPVFFAVVLTGSAALVLLQYFLTIFTAKLVIKLLLVNLYHRIEYARIN